MNDKTEIAKNIAYCWFNMAYNEEFARRSADRQDVEFEAVESEFGRLYEESERASANKWN